MSAIENLQRKRVLSPPLLGTGKISNIKERILERVDYIVNPPFNTKDGKPLETTFHGADEISKSVAQVITALPERIMAIEYILNNPDLTQEQKKGALEQINASK